MRQASCLDPIEIGFHGTQLAERRRLEVGPLMLAIPLGVWQKTGHALAGGCLSMLDIQARELVATKATPEAEQQHGLVAPVAQLHRSVARRDRPVSGGIQPLHDGFKLLQLQGSCLPGLRRMEFLNATQHLLDDRRLGRIGKALVDMPLR